MRVSAAKLALGVLALLAVVGTAVFFLQSEQQLTVRRGTLRGFDVIARESVSALTSLRSAQQGYVAPGQGLGVWMARVDTLLSDARARLDELHKSAASDEGRAMIGEAIATFDDLLALDKRARQYVNSEQPLMAADVLFSEAGETAAMAGRHVEAARRAEFVAFDSLEIDTRRQQAYAAGAAGLAALLVIAGLVFWPTQVERRVIVASREGDREDPAVLRASGESSRVSVPTATAAPEAALIPGTDVGESAPPSSAQLSSAQITPAPATRTAPRPVSPDMPRETVPVLTAAADLCVELTRARDVEELTQLLGRAAQVLDASGLVVWVGPPGAATLRPVLAHGYSPQALARMPPVPRNGDNAAAAAFRTGKLQIVLTRPGMSAGALAAPMLTPNGCIGALTAEIKNGGEGHDGVQALMAIVASQLAGVLAESILQAEDLDEDVPVSRIASA